MTEWKPISTAPKDGTKVLLFIRYSENETHMTIAAWKPDRHDRAFEWPWHSIEESGYTTKFVTHFMPLPAPPKGAENE